VDLRAIAEIAHRRGFKTYIDNSCLSPIFQKPLDFGIDLVMHTMSKFIGGHSDIIGGVLVGKDEELMRMIMTQVRELFGGIMGPMEAWLTIRGLRTLETRVRTLEKTGMEVAQFLEQQELVKKVYYTGLPSHPQADIIARQQTGHTSLMSFELEDEDPNTAIRLANSLRLFLKGCSWGGHESLVILPLLKEAEEAVQLIGGNRGLIRIYCGLEGSDNLIADLEQGLKHLQA
jgi:cystathionine gamma-lyase